MVEFLSILLAVSDTCLDLSIFCASLHMRTEYRSCWCLHATFPTVIISSICLDLCLCCVGWAGGWHWVNELGPLSAFLLPSMISCCAMERVIVTLGNESSCLGARFPFFVEYRSAVTADCYVGHIDGPKVSSNRALHQIGPVKLNCGGFEQIYGLHPTGFLKLEQPGGILTQ
jgi:hypothetical protein